MGLVGPPKEPVEEKEGGDGKTNVLESEDGCGAEGRKRST